MGVSVQEPEVRESKDRSQDPKGVLIGPAEHQLALQQVGVGATILPEPGAIFLEGSLTYRNAKLSAKVQLAEDPDLDGFYFKIENSSLQDRFFVWNAQRTTLQVGNHPAVRGSLGDGRFSCGLACAGNPLCRPDHRAVS